jgi:hypothetical protein
MIELRRALLSKIESNLRENELFNSNLAFPRKYFDDLIVSQHEQEIKTQTIFNNSMRGVQSEKKLNEMLSAKLPFGVVPAKSRPLLNLQSTG